jgi:hypothetical protein
MLGLVFLCWKLFVQGADKGQEFATPYEGLNNARIELSLTADGGVSFGTNIPLHFKPLTYCFFLLLKALTLDTRTFDKLEKNTRLFTPKQKEKDNIFPFCRKHASSNYY